MAGCGCGWATQGLISLKMEDEDALYTSPVAARRAEALAAWAGGRMVFCEPSSIEGVALTISGIAGAEPERSE